MTEFRVTIQDKQCVFMDGDVIVQSDWFPGDDSRCEVLATYVFGFSGLYTTVAVLIAVGVLICMSIGWPALALLLIPAARLMDASYRPGPDPDDHEFGEYGYR
jgi:hypothetical protein